MPLGSLNRIVWITVIVLICVLAWQVRDTLDDYFAGVGTLEVIDAPDRDTVALHWRGQIEAPMFEKLSEAFDQHRDRQTFIVSLSSPGGSLDHGAKVIRRLSEIAKTHRLETYVAARGICASMCVPIYLQGSPRSAAANARFMFHEVSFHDAESMTELALPESIIGSETGRFFAKWFKPAGVPVSWFETVLRDVQGGREVWKTGQELFDERANIVQQIN